MQVASVSCRRFGWRFVDLGRRASVLGSVFTGFGRRCHAGERAVVGFDRLRCA
jgi:hypothetical protein